VVDVVVGYLLASLLGAAKRKGDRVLDSALDNLVGRVQQRIGYGPTDTLWSKPRDPRTRADVQQQIQHAMWNDPAFALEVQRRVNELDRLGGRELIHYVDLTLKIKPEGPSRWWVALLVVLGIALCLAGLGLGAYTQLVESPNWTGKGYPPGTVRAFALFFAGFVVLALAGVAHAMTRNR
jgi:hypothetical protein